jgi:hypothetical protein
MAKDLELQDIDDEDDDGPEDGDVGGEEEVGAAIPCMDDEDEWEPGDVHAPCPPPSPTIGRETVDEEPFPGTEEDPEGDDAI